MPSCRSQKTIQAGLLANTQDGRDMLQDVALASSCLGKKGFEDVCDIA